MDTRKVHKQNADDKAFHGALMWFFRNFQKPAYGIILEGMRCVFTVKR